MLSILRPPKTCFSPKFLRISVDVGNLGKCNIFFISIKIVLVNFTPCHCILKEQIFWSVWEYWAQVLIKITLPLARNLKVRTKKKSYTLQYVAKQKKKQPMTQESSVQ